MLFRSTFFIAGTLPVPAYFRRVTDQVDCGLVLDIGHLWTVYRYSGAWHTQSLWQFLDEFLREFPVERVVEIHVAGLAVHQSLAGKESEPDRMDGDRPPQWTDAHAASIPPVLFKMLDHILLGGRLEQLRGVALEVDTKPSDLIADELARFLDRYQHVFDQSVSRGPDRCAPMPNGGRFLAGHGSEGETASLIEAYDLYAQVVSGRADPAGLNWTAPTACADDLNRYRTQYLPYEILHWGGDIEAMFPETCRALAGRQIALGGFVSYWFRIPHPMTRSYDFFDVKIDRFVGFVSEQTADLTPLVEREAAELRLAYQAANEGLPQSTGTRL